MLLHPSVASFLSRSLGLLYRVCSIVILRSLWLNSYDWYVFILWLMINKLMITRIPRLVQGYPIYSDQQKNQDDGGDEHPSCSTSGLHHRRYDGRACRHDMFCWTGFLLAVVTYTMIWHSPPHLEFCNFDCYVPRNACQPNYVEVEAELDCLIHDRAWLRMKESIARLFIKSLIDCTIYELEKQTRNSRQQIIKL